MGRHEVSSQVLHRHTKASTTERIGLDKFGADKPRGGWTIACDQRSPPAEKPQKPKVSKPVVMPKQEEEIEQPETPKKRTQEVRPEDTSPPKKSHTAEEPKPTPESNRELRQALRAQCAVEEQLREAQREHAKVQCELEHAREQLSWEQKKVSELNEISRRIEEEHKAEKKTIEDERAAERKVALQERQQLADTHFAEKCALQLEKERAEARIAELTPTAAQNKNFTEQLSRARMLVNQYRQVFEVLKRWHDPKAKGQVLDLDLLLAMDPEANERQVV